MKGIILIFDEIDSIERRLEPLSVYVRDYVGGIFRAPSRNGDTQIPRRRCHISQKLSVIKYLPPLFKRPSTL